MSKHLKYVEGYNGSLVDLANAIGYMQYDSVSIFLKALADNINLQSFNDKKRNRNKLSKKLADVAINIEEARKNMDVVWSICELYMKK
ncbi:MAG: hypothetical protein M0Q13_07105 [Methanothrix sp.]|jgi:hypothetical protein|nr:hypothetical protein [Methanothrix sp.]